MAESKANRDAFTRIHFVGNAHFAAALFPIIRIRAMKGRMYIFQPETSAVVLRATLFYFLSFYLFTFFFAQTSKFYITHRLEISLRCAFSEETKDVAA